MNTTLNKQLKDHLNFRVGALVNDSRTFLWVKCYQGANFADGKDPAVGGGNFLIALGAFASLNLLAKIYWILSKDREAYPLIDENIKRTFSNQKRGIKNLVKGRENEFNVFLAYCAKNIREGYFIPEKNAFYNLTKDLYRDKVNLGLGDEKEVIDKVWDDLRNAPSHIATPRGKVGGAYPVKPRDWNQSVLEDLETAYKTPFVKENGEVTVVAELLNEYVLRIKDWIFKKIDLSSASEDKVQACLKLLEV